MKKGGDRIIWLLRHGKDDETYIGGWSDVDLTARGEKQVKEAAQFLKQYNLPIERILSSDIKRARHTAEICGKTLGITPTYDEHLRELNKGKLNGMLKEQAMRDYPEYFHTLSVFKRFPQGESLVDFYDRMKDYVKHTSFEDRTLLVTHRGVINMFYFIMQERFPDYDKTQFGCSHASLHEFDPQKRLIKKIR